jgi:hypothetical protein
MLQVHLEILATTYRSIIFETYVLFISKMNFSHWKPAGVSERMWSVNVDVSMSEE